MKHPSPELLTLTGATGVLAASFLAFASTKSGSAYISIAHLPALHYALPVLGLITVVFALLGVTKKLELKYASLVLGSMMLGLTAFTGYQARTQLDTFVSMQYEMRARHDRFEADFNRQREAFDKAFDNANGSASAIARSAKSPAPDAPLVIADPDRSIAASGFYLSLLGSLLILVGGGVAFGESRKTLLW